MNIIHKIEKKLGSNDEDDLKLSNVERELITDLQELDFDAPYWLPKMEYGKVVKVHDGDTFHIIGIPQNGDKQVYKFVVRLNGIDTPELNKEPAKAERAKHELTSLILNKVVKLENVKKDKYGRMLYDIYIYDEKTKTYSCNVARTLIKKGLGYEYHGGKKEN